MDSTFHTWIEHGNPRPFSSVLVSPKRRETWRLHARKIPNVTTASKVRHQLYSAQHLKRNLQSLHFQNGTACEATQLSTDSRLCLDKSGLLRDEVSSWCRLLLRFYINSTKTVALNLLATSLATFTSDLLFVMLSYDGGSANASMRRVPAS